jgi:hypothetical protein
LLIDTFRIHLQTEMFDDILFPNPYGCPYFKEMMSFMSYIKLFDTHRDYNQKLDQLKNELKKIDPNIGNVSFTGFRDDIAAREVHNLPVPSNLLPFYEMSHKYAAMEITKANSQNLKLSCGLFVNLIRDNFIQSARKDQLNEK